MLSIGTGSVGKTDHIASVRKRSVGNLLHMLCERSGGVGKIEDVLRREWGKCSAYDE